MITVTEGDHKTAPKVQLLLSIYRIKLFVNNLLGID